MARIAIDATAFDAANPGSGQYRYAVDLIRGLRRLGSADAFLVVGSREEPPPELRAVFDGAAWRYRQFVPTRGRGAMYRDQARWALLLLKERIDLLHALHTFVPVLAPTPVVVTVYDLMFELFPEYAQAVRSRPWRLFRWAVRRRVRRVIAISEATASDLRRLWGVEAARIEVVLLGSDLSSGAARDRGRLSRRSALIVSPYNLEPRKNLGALLRAFALLRRETPDVRLTLFGRAAVTPEREAAFTRDLASLGLAGAVTITGSLESADLAALYARAALLVFPSLYEGFGLPLLEAMGAGACVVAVDASAMAEVVGDAGVLVESGGPEALAAAIQGLLRDPERCADLSARARMRAASFTVGRMAEHTHAVYRRILGTGRR